MRRASPADSTSSSGPGVLIEALGPYKLLCPSTGFKLTEDPFHLVNFAMSSDEPLNGPAIDLGTGCGVIPLLLASKTFLDVAGVELDKGAFDIAKRNVEDNGLDKRVALYNCDVRDVREVFKEGSFRTVFSNPPYIKAGSGRVSPDASRHSARHEQHGGLKDFVLATRYLVGTGGMAFFIYKTERLFEMCDELRNAGFSIRRLAFLRKDRGVAAKRFMVEAESGGAERPLSVIG